MPEYHTLNRVLSHEHDLESNIFTCDVAKYRSTEPQLETGDLTGVCVGGRPITMSRAGINRERNAKERNAFLRFRSRNGTEREPKSGERGNRFRSFAFPYFQ